MIADVLIIKDHDYILAEGKIGYKLSDHTIDYKTVYGYQTTFAYLKEYELHNIMKDVSEDFLGINIKCGHLSYAETPKEYYIKILGVTGTLQSLNL